jgi:hypothetical protein
MTRQPHRRPTRSAHRALPEGPFTVRAASANGLTPAAQRHAIGLGDLERLRRGVLDEPVAPDPTLPRRRIAEAANLRAARASSLACRRAWISHFAAAIALGIPTFGDIARPCLTVPAGTALRALAGVHLHRATVLDADRITVDGYPVTAPARTIMDIAREHGVPAGVVAADYALHEGLTDHESLRAAFDQCARWPGRKSARITLASADGAAESPLESISRLRMAATGLPTPRPQIRICDEYRRFIGRSDFYWDEFGVVGESDGDLKYERGSAAIVEERQRHKEFEDLGLIVVRWGWSDLFAFHKVARRLRAAYARGHRPGSPERRWGTLPPSRGLHP